MQFECTQFTARLAQKQEMGAVLLKLGFRG